MGINSGCSKTSLNPHHGKRQTPEKVDYNVHTLVTDLKSCSLRRDLQWGRKIHMKAVESRQDSNMYVMTALIRMYAKCGDMVVARRVFDNIQKPDVVSWNVLLQGYAENGDGLTALDLLSGMKVVHGCAPNSVTYIVALKACTSLAGRPDGRDCLKWGREIQSKIGCNLDISVQNALIDMYSKCGSMVDARHVFDKIQSPNVVSWTALLLGYVENGEGITALELFSRMKSRGCAPNSVTYIAALKACTSVGRKQDSHGQGEGLKRGRKIHSEISCAWNISLQNTLVDMYAKCGSMPEAHSMFGSIRNPDAVSWNALLLGYAESGDGLATLEQFSKMKACKCAPDSVTYVAALKACKSLVGDRNGGGQGDCLRRGRAIHSSIGCTVNIFVQSTLIDMYSTCGSMVDAQCVFDSIHNPDVVSWNSLLLGYVENGNGVASLELFSKMKACGCAANSLSYVAAIKGCGLTGALALGRNLHLEISEFTTGVVTCLVDFYAKCGSLSEAHKVFETHSGQRDVSTWTALLTGYGSFGDTISVFNLFEAMQDQGFQPDSVTFVCILSCCSHAGLVEKAREYFEAMPMQYGIARTVMHYTCMVDVLGRANQLREALNVLQKMPCSADAVTWMTLLGGCHKWKNVEIGRFAFQSLIDMDKKNAPAYVLMAHIYGSNNMWDEQEKVLDARRKFGASTLSGKTYVYDEMGNMVKFMPPEVKKILEHLESMKGRGYVDNVSCNSVELCDHGERRAVVYGMLRTPVGEPVRVFKNMRMCDECHGSSKMISELSGRVVMVRDSSRFHVMVNGSCSCGDYW